MRRIKKAAVLGSGVMGSRIACHFANIGLEVLLLDIAPKELSEKEEKAGLTLESSTVKNRIVNEALQFALKSNPSPIYSKTYVDRISTGNFDDDLGKISDCDWIIEVVIENLNIKKQVFDNVEKYRKPGSLITSNTSGIPINMMLDGRSEDFQKHFCGTHFFNPPRYLKLLEIIPSQKTDPEVVEFLVNYGEKYLGKTTVLCKDTPAFIANRVGVFSIMSLFHIVENMGLSVTDVDKLTEPVLGRPKSATFRTCDVVGLDTLVHVANGVKDNCPNDEAKDQFTIPGFISSMVENKWLGSKTKKGFYEKVKGEDGKSKILALDIKTLDYVDQAKTKYATLEATKPIENLKERIPVLYKGKDQAGEFYRESFHQLFSYVSHRIPEISNELFKVDQAMSAGFGWELGPFELWDTIGIEKAAAAMKEEGKSIAPWVTEMLDAGIKSFYRIEDGIQQYYDIDQKSYVTIPGIENFIILDSLKENNTVWSNSGCSLIDLGDGILNIEFHSKMNTMGGEVLEGLNKGIELAEKDFRGVVVGNQGANFSVGANLAMVFMFAVEQEYDEIEFAIRYFQDTMMKMRYSAIPVVVAPFGMALGGGCEISLHADKIQATAETYTGLVEFGVGLIPGGGGTKEFALRASDAYDEGEILLPTIKERYLTIGMAKVATSAKEAFELGIYKEGRDDISINSNRQIADAKRSAIELAEAGYTQKPQRKDITVLGKTGLGMFFAGANSMMSGHYISEHDKFISEKLAYVICGGDLSQPTKVSEQYLLDLEREAFLSLTGEKKTLQRIEHMLKTGKPLRN